MERGRNTPSVFLPGPSALGSVLVGLVSGCSQGRAAGGERPPQRISDGLRVPHSHPAGVAV